MQTKSWIVVPHGRVQVWQGLYLSSMFLAWSILALLTGAQVEARVFSSSFPRDRTWTSVRCFPLVTLRDQNMEVQAILHNPLSRPVTRYLVVQRAAKSVVLVEAASMQIHLEAGVQKHLRFYVPVTHRVYGSMLLWAGSVQRAHPLPGEVGSCAAWVLPVTWISGRMLGLLLMMGVLALVTWDLHLGARGLRRVADMLMAMGLWFIFFHNMWLLAALCWLMLLFLGLWAVLQRFSNLEAG